MQRYNQWSTNVTEYKRNVHEDIQGSSTWYTRQESGYNANRHEYSTWGNNTKAPSYNYDPEYRATEPYYTGHPYDGSLDLYFAENRFYDPETGSWLSPDSVMADQIGVLMAKLFSGSYEINEREFNRGWEDTSDLLTIFGMVMLLNGAAGAAKGNASGGNLQYTMAGGGTMDAAMAITAENAIVIAALNFMYLDKSNDGIIQRIEGESKTDYNWGNKNTLDDHYARHGNDVGATSAQDYAKKANDFYNNRTNYQVKVDSNGVTRVYDSDTNIFGSYNPDGTTRTLFSPTRGQAYFDSQPGNLTP